MLHDLTNEHSEGGQAGSMDVVKVYLRCGRSRLHSPYQAKDQGGECSPYICHPNTLRMSGRSRRWEIQMHELGVMLSTWDLTSILEQRCHLQSGGQTQGRSPSS